MKIVWQREPGDKIILLARCQYSHGAVTPTGLSDKDMDPVQEWCDEHKCGRRISFDMFLFRTEADMTTFLLKWS
jgi:hypothetical protein